MESLSKAKKKPLSGGPSHYVAVGEWDPAS